MSKSKLTMTEKSQSNSQGLLPIDQFLNGAHTDPFHDVKRTDDKPSPSVIRWDAFLFSDASLSPLSFLESFCSEDVWCNMEEDLNGSYIGIELSVDIKSVPVRFREYLKGILKIAFNEKLPKILINKALIAYNFSKGTKFSSEDTHAGSLNLDDVLVLQSSPSSLLHMFMYIVKKTPIYMYSKLAELAARLHVIMTDLANTNPEALYIDALDQIHFTEVDSGTEFNTSAVGITIAMIIDEIILYLCDLVKAGVENAQD